MKITVFGAGYVGTSLAAILCVKHNVVLVDIDKDKIDSINKGHYPVNDEAIHRYHKGKQYDLRATTHFSECKNSDFVIIATPTNYDGGSKHFDTSSVESILDMLCETSSDSVAVIRSTVPIGFTESVSAKYPKLKILFSPEFLSEGKAISDSLHPSRIIVGSPSTIKTNDIAEAFAKLVKDCTLAKDCEILLTGSDEAESIKLFSNTFLAMRISFFNELDSFAEHNGLDSGQIIRGVCLDPRIGDFYNNPSFGYGGYCLPKDTKQLRSNYRDIPNSLIDAIVDSNRIRKEFVAGQIISLLGDGKTVGIYRLIMKTGSDNFRESSIIDVIEILKRKKVKILIYEPLLKNNGYRVETTSNFDYFVSASDIIVANRIDDSISRYKDKIYCRDLFHRD